MVMLPFINVMDLFVESPETIYFVPLRIIYGCTLDFVSTSSVFTVCSGEKW